MNVKVLCKGRGYGGWNHHKVCDELVPFEGNHLCESCREAPNNCIVCGTGCSWWFAADRCSSGHPSLRKDYASVEALLRERLRYYETPGFSGGAMTYKAAENRAKIIAQLEKLATP